MTNEWDKFRQELKRVQVDPSSFIAESVDERVGEIYDEEEENWDHHIYYHGYAGRASVRWRRHRFEYFVESTVVIKREESVLESYHVFLETDAFDVLFMATDATSDRDDRYKMYDNALVGGMTFPERLTELARLQRDVYFREWEASELRRYRLNRARLARASRNPRGLFDPSPSPGSTSDSDSSQASSDADSGFACYSVSDEEDAAHTLSRFVVRLKVPLQQVPYWYTREEFLSLCNLAYHDYGKHMARRVFPQLARMETIRWNVHVDHVDTFFNFIPDETSWCLQKHSDKHLVLDQSGARMDIGTVLSCFTMPSLLRMRVRRMARHWRNRNMRPSQRDPVTGEMTDPGGYGFRAAMERLRGLRI